MTGGNNKKQASSNARNKQQQQQYPGCCARLVGEFKCSPASLFSLQDHHNATTMMMMIDAPASFSTRNSKLAVMFKMITCAATIVTLWRGIANIDDELQIFYLAYLTNWALILSVIYVVLSCLNQMWPVQQQPPSSNPFPGWRIASTWGFFEVAASSEILVTLLFWTLLYTPGEDTVSFLSILGHGGVMLLVLVEGLFINRIPVRLVHWVVFVLPFILVYMAWTVLHAALDVGNPNQMDEDDTTNDDAIYDTLNWRDEPRQTAVLSIVVVLVISPVLYFVLWLLSLYSWPCDYSGKNRRYLDRKSDNYQRMGSV